MANISENLLFPESKKMQMRKNGRKKRNEEEREKKEKEKENKNQKTRRSNIKNLRKNSHPPSERANIPHKTSKTNVPHYPEQKTHSSFFGFRKKNFLERKFLFLSKEEHYFSTRLLSSNIFSSFFPLLFSSLE